MGAMSAASAALYAELHGALMAEIERTGPEGVNKAAVVARFAGRGVSDRTLFRWASEVMESGEPGQALARQVKRAAADRAARVPDTAEAAAEVAAEAKALLPVRATVDDVAAAGAPAGPRAIPVLQMLAGVIADAQLVVAHAKHADGKPKMPKLLLQAGESLRRAAETALKITKSMHEIDELKRFHGELISAVEEVARKHRREIGEELLMTLRRVNAKWAGEGA